MITALMIAVLCCCQPSLPGPGFYAIPSRQVFTDRQSDRDTRKKGSKNGRRKSGKGRRRESGWDRQP